MFWNSKARKLLPAILTLFVLTLPAVAQYGPPPGYGRPPQRAAVLQYLSGEVSVAPSASNDWKAAQVNQRLSPPEYVWTAANSRAEINVGGAFLRMNAEASLTLSALSPSNLQVSVNQGEVELTVFSLAPGQIYEIDTPNATLTVSKSGVYSVEVRPSEEKTLVTTRKGAVVATGSGPAVKVDSGQQVTFLGGNSLQHTAQKAPGSQPSAVCSWIWTVSLRRSSRPRPTPASSCSVLEAVRRPRGASADLLSARGATISDKRRRPINLFANFPAWVTMLLQLA